MSYHPITMEVLASAHRADLFREAMNDSLGQQLMLNRSSRCRPLPGIFDTVTAALRHRQRVTATRIRRQFWTLPA